MTKWQRRGTIYIPTVASFQVIAILLGKGRRSEEQEEQRAKQ
jgi:hypothetical protein